MYQNFNFLFQYLEKEQIFIDKSEFIFQIESHPDKESLLAVSDTLSFFNIDNVAMRIGTDNIANLPNRFITLLNENSHNPQLHFVENKGNIFFHTSNKPLIAISKNELEQRWTGIVLLLEKPETKAISTTKNIFFGLVPTLFFLLFFAVLLQFTASLQSKLFFLFPLFGLLFSVAAIKDLFDVKSELINNFCNITASTSCTTVVSSTKWKIFEIINFSDLSMVFFGSQFLGLFIFLNAGDTVTYFSIQKIMILGAIPVLFLSIYYQKFVEKKWCPICMVIISIILLELVYLTLFQNIFFKILIKSVVVFGFVFLSITIIWSALKKLLTKQKELKDYQLRAIRFERNYDIFKNSLFSKDKVLLPQSTLLLGNKESKTIITIISSPLCSHCKDTHEIMDAILAKYYNDVQIQVILKTNLETANEEDKKLFRNLMLIYKQYGENAFTKALKGWFDNKNSEEWLRMFPTNTTTEFDIVFNNQYKWCEENDYNFTPVIFVNGYEYPKTYRREILEFFINDLIEDEF